LRKNGTFDIHPDWQQWAVLLVSNEKTDGTQTNNTEAFPVPSFLKWYWQLFRCEKISLLLEPIEGHGTWDHKNCFGPLSKQTDYNETVAVLTRATIRLNKMKSFWQHVPAVADTMKDAEGLLFSVGIGEVPFIKQATLSIWKSKEHMKAFAYRMKEHQKVIQKTRTEDWYKEEMFVRFKVLQHYGSVNNQSIKI